VPPESPTLGVTHLQFGAMLTASRESANPCDFALVAMLGLLGLRIFEATSANIADLGEEHGHSVISVCGKGTKVVLIPLPPAVGRAIDHAIGDRSRAQSCSITAGPGWTGMPPPRRLRHRAQDGPACRHRSSSSPRTGWGCASAATHPHGGVHGLGT
jgi:integrase/recombinase XerD